MSRARAAVAAKKLKLRRMLVLLRRMYGDVAYKRRGSGVDVLVSAMLSQNTNMANSNRGYAMLRRRFPTWTKVMNAPVGDVQREIAICGLARMRARRLIDMLKRIKAEQGALSLEHLAAEPVDAAYAYLTSFHGVGPKTAAFVLLFAFGRPVLPVDNGILRVVRRLKLVRRVARDAEAERTLSPLIANGRHYPTHVLLFRHAKARCKPRNPRCHECRLLEMCPWGQRVVKHRPPTDDELKPPRGTRPVLILAKYASAGLAKRREKEE